MRNLKITTKSVATKLTIEEKKMSILDKIAKEALYRPVTRGARPKQGRNSQLADGYSDHFKTDKSHNK
jgi:hypothetical protein